ncbi:hypothetical protein, partial [Escherichia coli]|uniref:hypothetical protein n=1 Tax=Escherichia coli TaxID=562 RepID=UPI001D153C5D
HTNRPLTDFGGKTSIFSHPVYLFLREFSLQDFRGGSIAAKRVKKQQTEKKIKKILVQKIGIPIMRLR